MGTVSNLQNPHFYNYTTYAVVIRCDNEMKLLKSQITPISWWGCGETKIFTPFYR